MSIVWPCRSNPEYLCPDAFSEAEVGNLEENAGGIVSIRCCRRYATGQSSVQNSVRFSSDTNQQLTGTMVLSVVFLLVEATCDAMWLIRRHFRSRVSPNGAGVRTRHQDKSCSACSSDTMKRRWTLNRWRPGADYRCTHLILTSEIFTWKWEKLNNLFETIYQTLHHTSYSASCNLARSICNDYLVLSR